MRFEISGPLSAPEACHCTQCRKQSGHFWASVDVARTDLSLEGASRITWFRSSEGVRRGFCAVCGSSLLWDPLHRDTITVALGSLEQPTRTRLRGHIYVAEQGDYYELADGLPQDPREAGSRDRSSGA